VYGVPFIHLFTVTQPLAHNILQGAVLVTLPPCSTAQTSQRNALLLLLRVVCVCVVCHPLTHAPGVCVSVSGVGERIMAAALARSTAMQLQADQATPPAQAAEGVLAGQLLTQQGPWDAGLIAVRVNTSSSTSSSSSDGGSSRDGGGSSSSKRGSGVAAQELPEEGGGQAGSTIEGDTQQGDCGPDRQQGSTEAQPQQQQQQQQQQDVAQTAEGPAGCVDRAAAGRLLRVEFVAAFTSPSFAVGYASRNARGAVTAEVQVLRGQQQHRPTAAAATGEGAAEGAAAVADDDGDGEVPPGVSCMEVCCCWPVQLSSQSP